jgi:hypothetical protein
MGASFGYVQALPIRRGEANALPLKVGRRPISDINRHVEDFTLYDSDQLSLPVRFPLIVKSAKHTAHRSRMVFLGERKVDSGASEVGLLI